MVQETASRFLKLDEKALMSELETLVHASESRIVLSFPPEDGEAVCPAERMETRSLSCRTYSARPIRWDWKVSSFSSLVSDRSLPAGLPDHDGLPVSVQEEQAHLERDGAPRVPSGIFAFPAGAKAGTFFHDVMEHLDFTKTDQGPMEALVADKLEQYRFESSWLEPVCRCLRKVLAAPLDPQEGSLKLGEVGCAERLNELEFHFPLGRISPGKLRRIFEENGGPGLPEIMPETIGRLQFAPTHGFMRGFMDLVFLWRERFYLIDWKSNLLGYQTEDYGREALTACMRTEFYLLQYHIYVLALDQFLRVRLPGYRYETHFGGCYYVFLRGVDPERPGSGIYRDRPSPQLVHALNRTFMERKGSS